MGAHSLNLLVRLVESWSPNGDYRLRILQTENYEAAQFIFFMTTFGLCTVCAIFYSFSIFFAAYNLNKKNIAQRRLVFKLILIKNHASKMNLVNDPRSNSKGSRSTANGLSNSGSQVGCFPVLHIEAYIRLES